MTGIENYSALKLRAMGFVKSRLVLIFSDWTHMEARTLEGKLLMEYSTSGSIDNINFVGNRYMACDFGCDGIMSYELKIWDFERSKWILEDNSYSNEYIVLGWHPVKPLLAAGYTNSKSSVEILNIETGEKSALTEDDSIDFVAFNQYNHALGLVSWQSIFITDENKKICREIPHEENFSTQCFCWIGGSSLATGHVNKKICIWDVNLGKMEKEFYISTDPMTIEASFDGRWLACSPEAEGESSTVIDLNKCSVRELIYEKIMFLPGGKQLCCGNQERIDYLDVREIFKEA